MALEVLIRTTCSELGLGSVETEEILDRGAFPSGTVYEDFYPPRPS